VIIDLTGRTAVVTGSTAGIGRAIAEVLARAGASVVISGRREERVAAALHELRALFPKREFIGVVADLATPEGAAELFAKAPDADILVNNVGTGRMTSFFEVEDREWIDLFELNVMSGIRASRHYVPNMMKRGWGRVVFISSESALAIPKDMIDYAMTKTAQLAIARGLAEVAGGTGVTVNSVLPGPTNSEIMDGWAQANAVAQGITREEAEQQFLKTMRPTTLLNRFATTEEVANLVVYLCSDQASATTGTSVRVDGGVVRTIA
jgi:NAD(P)-dependent dehydrogenase (short-subunit alcohol dehydrogenase family)